MNAKILITLALFGSSMNGFAQQENDSLQWIHRSADIGIIYPISTNGRSAGQYHNTVSFQLFAGVSGGVSACAVAGIGNMVKENGTGVLVGGLLNSVGHKAVGAQFAGIANITKDTTVGVQIAGVYNQSGDLAGIQLAGVGNVARTGSKAVQVAGAFNRAKAVHSQVAGLVNIAHKVNGVQLSGLVNIADSSDYPIGFINLVKNGEKSMGISTDEHLDGMVSFCSGGRVLYGILGVGYNLKKSDHHIYALQGGIGAHLFRKGKDLRLNAEAVELVQTDFSKGHCYTYSLKVLPEMTIAKRIQIFAGPTVNLQLDYSDGEISGLSSNHFWTTTGLSGHFIGAYFGMAGGLKIIL
ncbi:MAG TPA: hypothetical protein VFL76_01580 [Edaphocola sp.]|nr:hypothetical protein [Edaphocola sp.]